MNVDVKDLRKYLENTKDDWNYITPEEFKKSKEDFFVLDIRRPEDFKKGHIPGAKNIFWLDILKPENLKKLPKDKKILVYCYVGHTSSQVMTLLKLLGYDVVSLKFGMGESPVKGVPVAGWKDFGYETVTATLRMAAMKVTLDNAQNVPSVNVTDKGRVLCKVYVCRDGGIVSMDGQSLGIRQGDRAKKDQAEFTEAKNTDGIEIGTIKGADMVNIAEVLRREAAIMTYKHLHAFNLKKLKEKMMKVFEVEDKEEELPQDVRSRLIEEAAELMQFDPQTGSYAVKRAAGKITLKLKNIMDDILRKKKVNIPESKKRKVLKALEDEISFLKPGQGYTKDVPLTAPIGQR